MEKIKTATGKQFNVNYLSRITDPDQIYIRIAASVAEVAIVFSDKKETNDMIYGDTRLIGYTDLASIIPESDVVRICLRKEN